MIGPRKQKIKSRIRNTAPSIAMRLRTKRSKAIRPWLRLFWTNAGVSSRRISASSAWVGVACSNVSITVLLSGVLASGITDAWVHNTIENIGDQVEGDDQRSSEH